MRDTSRTSCVSKQTRAAHRLHHHSSPSSHDSSSLPCVCVVCVCVCECVCVRLRVCASVCVKIIILTSAALCAVHGPCASVCVFFSRHFRACVRVLSFASSLESRTPRSYRCPSVLHSRLRRRRRRRLSSRFVSCGGKFSKFNFFL